jgi:hypothetical protein
LDLALYAGCDEGNTVMSHPTASNAKAGASHSVKRRIVIVSLSASTIAGLTMAAKTWLLSEGKTVAQAQVPTTLPATQPSPPLSLNLRGAKESSAAQVDHIQAQGNINVAGHDLHIGDEGDLVLAVRAGRLAQQAVDGLLKLPKGTVSPAQAEHLSNLYNAALQALHEKNYKLAEQRFNALGDDAKTYNKNAEETDIVNYSARHSMEVEEMVRRDAEQKGVPEKFPKQWESAARSRLRAVDLIKSGDVVAGVSDLMDLVTCYQDLEYRLLGYGNMLTRSERKLIGEVD